MDSVSDKSAAQLAEGNSLADAPLRVSEVMTSDTLTMRPHQNFAEVVWMMSNRSFHHMLVVDSDTRLCGVISDRDVLRALSRSADWSKKRVSEIMTRDSITITPDATISAAIREMLGKKINCLPVVAPDGRVCGIVTSTDLLAAYGRIQARIEESGNAPESPIRPSMNR